MKAKRVGVVLSGCGFKDGAEIQEVVLALLALDRRGVTAVPLAPDVPQADVVDHAAGKVASGEVRNILVEAARITRGEVAALSRVALDSLDAVVFPGGYGVAKSLCTFAREGASMTVLPEVRRLIEGCFQAKKPMGFICIAPVLAAKVLGAHRPTLTVGDDAETIVALEAMGAKHLVCKVDEVAVDLPHRLVSTPAYMSGPSIAPVSQGIDRLVGALLELVP